METKTTKQRLDELQDLLQAKYITESEFRAARINVLRESGFDFTFHGPRRKESEIDDGEDEYLEEMEPRGRGCGCFLSLVFLAVVIVLGILLAAPEWPDEFGGQYVRQAREEAVSLWNSFFSPEETNSGSIPDPLKSRKEVSADVLPKTDETSKDETPDMPSKDVSGRSSPPLQQPLAVASVPATPSPVALEGRAPKLDISVLPDGEAGSGDPQVIIVEIPPSLPDPVPEETALVPKGTGGMVSSNAARIRSAPNTLDTTNVLGWARRGERFTVLERSADSGGGSWYRVRFEANDKEGWVSGTLVKLEL
ncbi:MAG: SH3 domain-containing protein [Synergistaceae bacterium]|jgi:hypothetical protein|nr:SH3 domain-containing protein [Synergistaceae bacterium]